MGREVIYSCDFCYEKNIKGDEINIIQIDYNDDYLENHFVCHKWYKKF
jgi:hypothetical protein